METFLHFKSTTMSPCSMNQENFSVAMESWLCSECNWVLPGYGAIDVVIKEKQIRNTLLSGVVGTGIALIHEDFLAIFQQPTVSRFLSLGKVYASTNRRIDGWYTVNPKEKYILRGEKDVAHRVCPACQRNIYYGAGKAYVSVPCPPTCGVFGTDLYGLLSKREELTLTTPKFRGVEILEVPFVEPALDGLGALGFYNNTTQPSLCIE